MDEKQRDASLYAVVKIAIEGMDPLALNAQYLTQLLGGDPRQRLGYDKVKPLFTEQNGTKMHEETRRIFLHAAQAQLFPTGTEGGQP